MDVLRTPDDRFAGLADFPFPPHYAEITDADKPLLTAFSDGDPVTRGGEKIFQMREPGANGQAHVTLRGGHFLQEDCPLEIADLIDTFMKAASLTTA